MAIPLLNAVCWIVPIPRTFILSSRIAAKRAGGRIIVIEWRHWLSLRGSGFADCMLPVLTDLARNLPRNVAGNPDFPPSRRLLNVVCRCSSGFLKRITYTIMPYKTGIRLIGVARNPANGFPAKLLWVILLTNRMGEMDPWYAQHNLSVSTRSSQGLGCNEA